MLFELFLPATRDSPAVGLQRPRQAYYRDQTSPSSTSCVHHSSRHGGLGNLSFASHTLALLLLLLPADRDSPRSLDRVSVSAPLTGSFDSCAETLC
ncbi:hypothetical protein LX32DRAFT_643050 [Colletotrichum zoysiae]|uniref:Uncharacterized protein n=1 Tax=Colletotrichum zoysiae TaxID=1216348 RepID=A0AAD9HA90_9PEZI|nr:hypothetical protein LX32DRAFT_643050 [Colletotrichum zoysiae]